MNDDDILLDTLHVSGLPDVDQDDIDEAFSAFGSVESIKFLDSDKKTAFVKFNSSREAEDAHKYSKGLLIKDALVKVTWGRRSHLIPKSTKQQKTSSSSSYSSSSSHHNDYYHHHQSYHHSSSSYHDYSQSHHSNHNSHSRDRDYHDHYSSRSNERDYHSHSSHSRDRSHSSHGSEHNMKDTPEVKNMISPSPQQKPQNYQPTNSLLCEISLNPDQEDQLAQLFEKLDGSMESIKSFSTWIVLNTLSEFSINPVILGIVSQIQKADHQKKLVMLFVLTDVFCQKYLTFSMIFYKHFLFLFKIT